jgi:hypothetical protein
VHNTCFSCHEIVTDISGKISLRCTGALMFQ